VEVEVVKFTGSTFNYVGGGYLGGNEELLTPPQYYKRKLNYAGVE